MPLPQLQAMSGAPCLAGASAGSLPSSSHGALGVCVCLSVSVFRVPPCFKDVRYFGLWVHTQDLFLT